MNFSCSGLGEIWEIPDSGSAFLAGYWSPTQGLVEQRTRVEWRNGKLFTLEPIGQPAPPSESVSLSDHPNRPESCQSGNIHRIDTDSFAFAGTPGLTETTNLSKNPLKQCFNWDSFYLLPGFLDAHVHLALDSIDFYRCLQNWSNAEFIETTIQTYLKDYFRLGIVAVRDGSDLPGYAWKARQNVTSGLWVGPKILSTREAVHRSGMYGRFLGRGFETVEAWLAKHEDFFAQGLDQLKVIVTGLIKFDTYHVVGPTQWNVVELKRIVQTAHERGLAVMAHASGEEGITVALAAGVDTIEHGYYITTDHLRKMAEKRIAWVPTVAPIGNILLYDDGRYSDQEKSVLTQILEDHLAKIHLAYEWNIPLGIGTDAGAYLVPHAESFFDELRWYQKAGLPQHDILKIATQGNAQILGWPDFGKLEAGIPMEHLQLTNLKTLWKYSIMELNPKK